MTESSEIQDSQRPKSLSSKMTLFILLGLVLGIIVGVVLGLDEIKGNEVVGILTGGVFTFIGQAFLRMMQMLVVPLVFCSIVCGAASIGSGKMLGKVGGLTVLFYLVTTALAVLMALGVGHIVNPGMGIDLTSIESSASLPEIKETTLVDTLLNIFPKNVFAAFADGTMLQIIFFALILGVILGQMGPKADVVRRFFEQMNAIMMKMVGIILFVAPLGVFCLVSVAISKAGIDSIWGLVKYVGGTYIGLLLQLCVVYMIMLVVFTGINPLRFLGKMSPVMMFAFSSSSSNATIPINMETLEQKIGVSPKIAGFTIPLGATVNMDGTAIMQGVAVVFASQAFGIDLGVTGYFTVILTATLASIGTAGVPGAGTIMLAMVFNSVGLPIEGVSLLMGVDRLVDMGRTAVNVMGDAVVTTIVAKFNGALDTNVFENNALPAAEAVAESFDDSEGGDCAGSLVYEERVEIITETKTH